MAQNSGLQNAGKNLCFSSQLSARKLAQNFVTKTTLTQDSDEDLIVSPEDDDLELDDISLSKRMKSACLQDANIRPPSTVCKKKVDSSKSDCDGESLSEKANLEQRVNKSSVNIVYKVSRNVMSDGEITKTLRDAELGKLDQHIMKNVPVFPRGGDVILYRCKTSTDQDYLCDQYTGLRNNGRSCGKDSDLHRKYYALKDKNDRPIHGFKKTVFWLPISCKRDDRVILIHYEGNENIWTARSHGNSKDSSRMLTRNTPTAKSNIDKTIEVTGAKPAKVYQKVNQQASKVEHFEERQPAVGARDKKQVENRQYQMKLQSRVHDDDILAIYSLGRHKALGNFIRGFRLLNCEAICVAEDAAIELANALMKEASHRTRPVPLCFGVDTTFDLGDCFVTPMIMRNILFDGDPIFPLGFLLHETKETEAHQFFLSTMAKFLPLQNLPTWCPFVTDREGGILKAARLELKCPGIVKENDSTSEDAASVPVINFAGDGFHHVLCSLHIKRDVKYWIKNHKGQRADETVLLSEVDVLLNCETVQEFEETFSNYEQKWTQTFKDYMVNMKVDLRRAGRFYTKQFPSFTNLMATSNFIESFNSILKQSHDWEGLRYECVLLNLFNTQLSYMNEFPRSFQSGGIGNYHPKQMYAKGGCRFKLPEHAYWEPTEFLKKFKENHPPDQQKLDILPVHGDRALGRLACDLGYICLNPQIITYTVTGPYDLTRHTVEEDDAGQLLCSCPKPGLCLHREAYLRVTKKTLEEGKTKWRLSEIRRATRGFKGPTGRKPRKKIDDADVIPAPDSDLAKRRAQLDVCDVDSHDDGEDILADNPNLSSPTNGAVLENVERKSKQVLGDEVDEMDEDDYTHDAMGLHHYSRLACVLDNDGNKSAKSTLSGLSEGPTPEYFKIPKASLYLKPETYRGRLESLRPDCQLSSKVVDNMMALVIKVHGLEDKVALASSMTFAFALQVDRFDCAGHLLSWAKRSEAINTDVLLVSIMSTDPNHFFLGAVIWRLHIVVIINSMPGYPSNVEPHYVAVLRIIQASYLVAGAEFDADAWTFHEEMEMPRQKDGTSCGVWSITNAFCLCSKTRLFTEENQPEANHLRKWIAKCLQHEAVGTDCILLREGDLVRHLRRIEKIQLGEKMRGSGPFAACIERKSSWRLVVEEIRGINRKDGKCQSSHCTDDLARRTASKIKCVACHSKFHEGVCVPLSNTQRRFYICPDCSTKNDQQETLD